MEQTALTTVILTPIVTFLVWVLKQEYTRFRNRRVRPTTKLMNHELLQSYFDNRLNFINNIWNISDKGRQSVVRIALTAKINIWRKHLTRLAKELDELHETERQCPDLYSRNMIVFRAAIEEYTHFFEHGNFSEEEKKIFKIFMDKFQKYHLSNIKAVEGFIFRACMNDLIKDYVEIEYMIFSNYLSAFDITFMDMNDTIATINGELTGMVINGIEIGELREVD